VRELTEADAIVLLAKLSGTPESEPLLRQVAKTLGQLPLALELAGKLARQQARRPGFSWETFANYFSEGDKRLSLGLAGTNVRAAFDATWSHALEMEIQRSFTLLGIFKVGDIYTAEAAAAWDADEQQARDHLNQLLDLSLVRLIDPVTIQLHPLLADYAKAMLENYNQEERISAHCRVADHLFQAIPRPLQSLSDMAVLLRSHYHAAMARDRERADRVYPWFDDGTNNIAVSGFLIDHGQKHALVELRRQDLQFSENASAWSRSFEYFYLGDALRDTGQFDEAEECMLQAVKLMEAPDIDEHSQSLGLGKFLMGLGQIQAQMGKLDEAEASFQQMVDFDRKIQASGEVVGAHDGALIGLLQLADLYAQSTKPDGIKQTERICRAVYDEARQYGIASIAIMALARLTNLYEQPDPDQALETLNLATEIGKTSANAFSGRQGARYARYLAESAAVLALNGKPALENALDLLCHAISNAGQSDAWQELGQALYQLGNLFEHYFIVGRDSPLTAAWACYALSGSYLKENEGGSPLNAQFRINERIVPRIEEANRASAAEAVVADPWGLIETALSPRKLDWRPDL
jgi:tetratricopeptide (TPR) repeat protein